MQTINQQNNWPKSFPVFSIILTSTAFILFFLGEPTSNFLQYDRTAIAAGQLWRIITGHFTHWSVDHLLWNIMVFMLIGSLCEYHCRKGYLLTLGTAAFIIPLTTWLFLPDMAIYRGLSGLDSALFIFAASLLAFQKYGQREWGGMSFFMLLCVLFTAKLIFETSTGSTVFAASSGIFKPVPLAHLSGGLVGSAAILPYLKRGNHYLNNQAAKPENETVILLHGLGRTSRSMGTLAKALQKVGYQVINLGYPSRQTTIESLVETHISPKVRAAAANSTKVHFVTHSLGGILVRYALQDSQPDNLGRVVMLSPPNQGSEIVDTLAPSKIFQKIMGPAALQLGTDKGSVPLGLGPVNFELGVIAGSCAYNPFFSKILGDQNDGLVAVQRMPVNGMADFCEVPYSHTFLMNRQQSIKQVIAFLQTGHFIK